jgi:hypothetical protein
MSSKIEERTDISMYEDVKEKLKGLTTKLIDLRGYL